VRVSLIIPGFVKTPLNDSIDAIKPLEMTGSEAALLIQRVSNGAGRSSLFRDLCICWRASPASCQFGLWIKLWRVSGLTFRKQKSVFVTIPYDFRSRGRSFTHS